MMMVIRTLFTVEFVRQWRPHRSVVPVLLGSVLGAAAIMSSGANAAPRETAVLPPPIHALAVKPRPPHPPAPPPPAAPPTMTAGGNIEEDAGWRTGSSAPRAAVKSASVKPAKGATKPSAPTTAHDAAGEPADGPL